MHDVAGRRERIDKMEWAGREGAWCAGAWTWTRALLLQSDRKSSWGHDRGAELCLDPEHSFDSTSLAGHETWR